MVMLLNGRTAKVCLAVLFYDVLKPYSILSKCLQDEELNIVDAIEAIIKTNKSVSQLKLSSLDDLPSVKKVKSRIQKAQGETTYLGAPLANFEQGITFITTHKDQIIESVLSCLKSRIKIQHPDLLTDALILLATQTVWVMLLLVIFVTDLEFLWKRQVCVLR